MSEKRECEEIISELPDSKKCRSSPDVVIISDESSNSSAEDEALTLVEYPLMVPENNEIPSISVLNQEVRIFSFFYNRFTRLKQF